MQRLRCWVGDTGVRKCDVNLPELLVGSLEQAHHLCFVGHVAAHDQGLPAQLTNALGRPFVAFHVDVTTDNMGPGLGHGLGELEAQSIAGSGDDCNLAG